MAKSKSNIPSIYDIGPFLKEDKLLPVYFFVGSDGFTIDSAVKAVEKAVNPLLSSDFDKEVISAEKNQKISSLVDIASAFPFGTGKKLIIVKNFEKFSDRKSFSGYINNPAESTILVITQPQKSSGLTSEPYSSMIKQGFLFEAEELKGPRLLQWVVTHSGRNKLKISRENAATLVDLVGEDKSMLEMHIRKFGDVLGENSEITLETIKQHTSTTKEHSIFDLQDAMGRGDKPTALDVAYNLLENGKDAIYLITMITKYIITIARTVETASSGDDNSAARQIGVSWFYYKKCKEARYLRNETRLLNASRALLEADKTLKTTAVDQKSLISVLILEILK